MLISVFQIHPKHNLIICTFQAANKEQGKQFQMLPISINFTGFNHLQSSNPFHGHLIKLPISLMITYLVTRGPLGLLL